MVRRSLQNARPPSSGVADNRASINVQTFYLTELADHRAGAGEISTMVDVGCPEAAGNWSIVVEAAAAGDNY